MANMMKHELANKKMQEMKLKNEEILKRFQVFFVENLQIFLF
jgi:hypothetical protein